MHDPNQPRKAKCERIVLVKETATRHLKQIAAKYISKEHRTQSGVQLQEQRLPPAVTPSLQSEVCTP